MISAYTREDEANLPTFQSHDEARAYFKEKHGDNFQLVDSFEVLNQTLFKYFLLLDKSTFWELQKEMNENGYLLGKDSRRLTDSYQVIEIYEDGAIHIVY